MVECGILGKPSSDKQLRVYTQAECDQLNGDYTPKTGECLSKTGGSFSSDCRYLNDQESTSTTKLSTGAILGIITAVVILSLLIIRGLLSFLIPSPVVRTGGGKRKSSILLLGGIAVLLLFASTKMF